MPVVRYQIRNEYGLADPELYGAADKDDPEALLEGVAMAGLVGVLRQLGDLAEFAAEVFHNLHEEVMGTAARGHALMLRVQQLEVDFPAIERDLLSPSGDSKLSYNAGVEWHPNLQIDENLITREDMPRFVLDCYEESRGPPRLFMLDKFDIAGDGACLKRFSDPSFFKTEFAASGKSEPDIQREKRSRRNKKKASRWRNGETPEFMTHVNLILEHGVSEKAPENLTVKRVKLKRRQLSDSISFRRSYIECIVGNQSPQHNNLPGMESIDSAELAPVREVIMDTPVDRPFFRQINQRKHDSIIPSEEEERISNLRDHQNKKHKGTASVEMLPLNIDNEHCDLSDAVRKRQADYDSESRTGSLDGCRSDDAASDLDNYLDALTTMDSEIEIDNEVKAIPGQSFLNKDLNEMDYSVKEETTLLYSNANKGRDSLNSEMGIDLETKTKLAPTFFSKENKMDSDANEERELLDEHPCPGTLNGHPSLDMARGSSLQSNLTTERMPSPNACLSILADSTSPHAAQMTFSGMLIDTETPADENHDKIFDNMVYSEPLEKESSTDLVSEQKVPSPLCESGVQSSNTNIKDIVSTQTYKDLHASSDVIQLDSTNVKALSVNNTSSEKSSPVTSDILLPAAGRNVISCNPDEHGGVENIMKDDFLSNSDGYKTTPVADHDEVTLGVIAKDPAILHGALLQLVDDSDLNLKMHDGLILEEQTADPCTEEPSTEGIPSISIVSDPSEMNKVSYLEISTPICIDDISPPLSMFDEDEVGGSVSQGYFDSGRSTIPKESPPIPPLGGSSGISEPDEVAGFVGASLLSDEKFECERTSSDPDELVVLAVNEVTTSKDINKLAENEMATSGMTSPGPSTSSDQTEFRQVDKLLKTLEIDSSAGGTGNSPLLNVTQVSPSTTGEASAQITLYLTSESANEVYSATTPKDDFSLHEKFVDEDHVSDSVSDQQKLGDSEASSMRDLIDLDVWKVPGTSAYPGGLDVASGFQGSGATGYSLDSSFLPEDGELTDLSSVEQCELAEKHHSLTVDLRVSISFAELEGEGLGNPVPKIKSASVNSDVDHYVGNIEASYPEDMPDTDIRVTSISSPRKEEAKAVGDLGESNSAESICDSCGNIEVKPKVSVPCQEDQKVVVSPWGSRSEESLPKSSDTTDVEIAKNLDVMIIPLEVNEDVGYPSESQICRSFDSNETCQGVETHGLVPNNVITENEGSMREVLNLESYHESSEFLLIQNFGKFNLSEKKFEGENSYGQHEKGIETPPLVPETTQDSVDAVSSAKTHLSDISSAHEFMFDQQETGAGSSFQSNHGIPAVSPLFGVPVTPMQTFPGLSSVSTSVAHHQSSELSLDEDPPLPPLPPLQWRMGKLRPSSITSNGKMAMPQSGPNSLTALPSFYHQSTSSLVTSGTVVQQVNSVSLAEMHPKNNDLFDIQPLVKEEHNSFLSSTVIPAFKSKNSVENVIAVDAKIKHLPENSTAVCHVEEDQQKNESSPEAIVEEIPLFVNSFMSTFESSNEKSEHSATVCVGESVEPLRSSVSLPSSAFSSEPLKGMQSMEMGMIHSSNPSSSPKSPASQSASVSRESLQEVGNPEMPTSNPFLSSASTGGEPCTYNYGTSGEEWAPQLNTINHSSTAETSARVLLISQEDNMQAFESLLFLEAENQKPNGRPRSLLNRPRDPLIEAVAAHDRSTLRRVSEMVRPTVKPESERNTLLEQIRNKTFNLKPATVPKPHISVPPTNLKVAAILEKANAIRQAFAGSDEDDDGDSWSDS